MSANINRIPAAVKDLTDNLKIKAPIVSILVSIKNKWDDHVSIDSYIFSLHSTVTVAMLIFFTSFLTMKQYFGDVIECLDIPSAAQSLSSKQMTNYCWMEGAFTIVNRYIQSADEIRRNNYEVPGHDVAYPGIKAYKPHQGDLKMPHKYYQWIYYILVIQSCLFFVPKMIWRLRERGRLTQLIKQLRDKRYIQLLISNDNYHFPLTDHTSVPSGQPPRPGFKELPEHNANEILQDLADTILISDQYYGGMVKAEILYFVHLICEIIFIHLFLGRKFICLGSQWLYYTSRSDDITFDPLIRIFPRLTKCSFHKFGASGSLETYDTLCFMPMNIVNEKIFVILWFWFVILFVCTSIQLVWNRLFARLSAERRLKRLEKQAPCAKSTNSAKDETDFLKTMSQSPSRSFVLQLIAKNLKPNYFRYYINQVSKHFEKVDKKLNYSSKLPLGFINLPTAPLINPGDGQS